MSEEILKALMQLFAILARQDGVLIANHEEYVFRFLSSQLSADRIKEYLQIYNDFLNETRPEPAAEKEKDKKKKKKEKEQEKECSKEISLKKKN